MNVPTELKVVQSTPTNAVVEALGEHDLSTRDEAAELFGQLVAENDLVVVDLSQAYFIDSSFLNNLVQAQRAARKRGHTLVLQIGTEPAVRRLLEITRFLDHFDHAYSRQEALAWAGR